MSKPSKNDTQTKDDTTAVTVRVATAAPTAPELPPPTAAELASAAISGVPVSQVVAHNSRGNEVVDTTTEPDTTIDDPETDGLVADIVEHEGDDLLAAQDTAAAEAAAASDPANAQRRNPLMRVMAAWWHNRLARYGSIAFMLLFIVALFAIPTSRYVLMNSSGVRSQASLTIYDQTTRLPLKNVAVSVGDVQTKSNQDGVVKLSGLKLGPQQLSVAQAGFAGISKAVTLGLGSNPLGDFSLQAVGAQFRFKLTDYLSGKAVKDAEMSSGDSNAQASTAGQIVLTVDQDGVGKTAKITAKGYRTETVSLTVGQSQNRSLALVPAQKEVYISKQSGRYDLYKMDIDGRDRKLLLAASGREDANIGLVQRPGGNQAALISIRDTTVNQDGYPLQSLTIIDVNDGTTLTLDHSERIQLVDWIGNSLIYVKIKAGTSAGNAERYQLMSYDYDTTSRLQLATANYFSDIVSMQGKVYYAASNDYQGGVSQLARINPDSTGKQVLLDKTSVWDIARTSADSLAFNAQSGAYQYKIGDSEAKKVGDKPANQAAATFYLDAPNGKQAVVTDTRDGKGVLLGLDIATGKQTTLVSQAGLGYPLRWVTDRVIVYRVVMSGETADYAISLDGGSAKKVTDLTDVAGFGKWNYR